MSTTEFIKIAYNVLKEANRLDLAEDIITFREELIDLKERNLKLEEENAELKQKIKIKSQIVFERGICWIVEDEMTNATENTPICPLCWQQDGIVNRITPEQYMGKLGIACRRNHGVFKIK